MKVFSLISLKKLNIWILKLRRNYFVKGFSKEFRWADFMVNNPWCPSRSSAFEGPILPVSSHSREKKNNNSFLCIAWSRKPTKNTVLNKITTTKKRLLLRFKNGIMQKKVETFTCPGIARCFYFKTDLCLRFKNPPPVLNKILMNPSRFTPFKNMKIVWQIVKTLLFRQKKSRLRYQDI